MNRSSHLGTRTAALWGLMAILFLHCDSPALVSPVRAGDQWSVVIAGGSEPRPVRPGELMLWGASVTNSSPDHWLLLTGSYLAEPLLGATFADVFPLASVPPGAEMTLDPGSGRAFAGLQFPAQFAADGLIELRFGIRGFWYAGDRLSRQSESHYIGEAGEVINTVVVLPVVEPAPLRFHPPIQPWRATAAVPFRQALPTNLFEAGDITARVSISLSDLPPGLQFDSTTGEISGTPRAAGLYHVFITARDETVPAHEVSGALPFEVQSAVSQLVYEHDFEADPGSEWSLRRTSSTPVGNRRFLGEFGSNTARLSLTNLPPHTVAMVEFDLYVIRTWDGNSSSGDTWLFQVDGITQLRTTFHTGYPGENSGQRYPLSGSVGTFPPNSGAQEIGTLGYLYNLNGQPSAFDAVYHMAFTVAHTNANLALAFQGLNLQELADESWGLDNVRVSVVYQPEGVLVFDPPVTEVSEATPTATFNVRRIGGSLGPLTVDYQVAGLTAVPEVDFVPQQGRLTFAHGQSNETITVELKDNNQPENDKAITLRLLNSPGATLSPSVTAGHLLISDDDSFVELVRTNFMLPEGTAFPPAFELRRVGATNRAANVRFRFVGRTASPGPDFDGRDEVLTFAPGQTSLIAGLYLKDDSRAEPDETFLVQLSEPSLGFKLGQSSALVTILDNDSPVVAIGANNAILAADVSPDGKVVIGGGFFDASGLNRVQLARLNPDGSVDSTFNTSFAANSFPGGWVMDVGILPNGQILALGEFDRSPAIPRGNIGFWTSSGRLVSSTKSGTGANGSLFAHVVDREGRILVGGAFTQFNGTNRASLVRLQADGTLDLTFDPGGGPDFPIRSLAMQLDGRILVAGNFTTFDGRLRNRLARLNPDGSLDTSFAPGTEFDAPIEVIQSLPDGQLMVAGWFEHVGPLTRHRLARLRDDGTLDATWSPDWEADGRVVTLAFQSDGSVLAGGDFTRTGRGRDRRYFARLKPDGSYDQDFNRGVGPNGRVGAVRILADHRIFVAGDFTLWNGVPVNRVVFLNPDGSVDQPKILEPRWVWSDGPTSSEYSLTKHAGSWEEAEAEAISLGGHLVAIGSLEEQRFLEAVILTNQVRLRPLWLGLRETFEPFGGHWLNGDELRFTNWEDAEPAPGAFAVMNLRYSLDGGRQPEMMGRWSVRTAEDREPFWGIIERPHLVAPIIVRQPHGTNVFLGQTVQLTVEAAGPDLRYQWRWTDLDLANATNATFNLAAISTNLAGPYRVLVSNSTGNALSEPAEVVITAPEVRILGESVTVDGKLRIKYQLPEGAIGLIEQSLDLKVWTPMLTNEVSGSFTLEVPIASGASFLRCLWSMR